MNGYEFSEDPSVQEWSEALGEYKWMHEDGRMCTPSDRGWLVDGFPAVTCDRDHGTITAPDPVAMPSHYTQLPVECIDVTEHFGFCLGNAIKYIWRADHKGKPLEDLRKAAWYIEREIQRREREQ